jgi:ribonuclease P protein component
VVYLLTAEPLADPTGRPVLVGLTVGRAVGNAVARHRASRRLRAILAQLLPSLPSGSRVVVRALPGADTTPHLAEDVRVAVDAVLARVGVRT